MIGRSTCIISCFFLMFTVGCHAADYMGEEQKEVKETMEKLPDDLSKEAKEEENRVEQDSSNINDEYDSFLWKAWIVDRPKKKNDDSSFIITKASDGVMEGFITVGHNIDSYYWSDSQFWREQCKPFKGTITENQAECTFLYEECQAVVTFLFHENDRIEAKITCDKRNISEKQQFRPYNLSDEQLNDDMSSASVYFETWGEVNLVSATTDNIHSVPYFYITNNEGDIFYRESCLNGLAFWDVFVEDLDQDGRQDIWTVICFPESNPKYGCKVNVFYQTKDGHFYEDSGYCEELPNKYFGEYLVTRFCPAEGYDDISETVLTKREAEQMIGKSIVIQDNLFVAYDSERRRGTRGNREVSTQESMITEYSKDFDLAYLWYPVSPETLIHEAYPDETLRVAVGEDCYGKINGVFYEHFSAGWLRFYTLEGEETLIMHSILTGQNFMLEKEGTDN